MLGVIELSSSSAGGACVTISNSASVRDIARRRGSRSAGVGSVLVDCQCDANRIEEDLGGTA